jgi:hypothetical protein
MKTLKILSITALALLGVCLLCGLAKMAMKGDKAKQSCDKICILSLIVALVLLGYSQFLKEENNIFIRMGFVPCRKGRNRCYGMYPKWKENNKHQFRIIIRELMKAGKHPFLSGGSLLGYARQGDLLDNDDDMSFGLFDEEYDDELYKIIKKLGYNLHTHQTNKGKQLTINKGNKHNNTDIEIDIDSWFRRNNMYYFFTKFTKDGEQFKITPFKLVFKKIWGMNIYIPDNYERVLEEQYGNWKYPNPEFSYLSDSPSYIKDGIVKPESEDPFPNILKNMNN